MGDAISKLLTQLELPAQQEVPEPTVGRKIMSKMSDALMNYASVMAGGGPAGTPAQDKMAGETQRKQAEQTKIGEQNRQTRNAVRVEGFKSQQEADQRAAADSLLRTRQQEDDARASNQKRVDFITSQLADMAKDGYQADPTVKPEDMGYADLIRIKADFYQKAGLGKNSKLAAGVQTLLDLEREHPELAPSVQADDEGNLKFTVGFDKPEKAGQAGKRRPGDMTDAAMLKIQQTWHFNPAAPEFLKEDGSPDRAKIMARIQDIQKDWVPLPPAVSDKLVNLTSLLRSIEEVDRLRDASQPGKPFATTVEEAQFRAVATNLADLIIRARSGATVREDEEEKAKYFRAKLGQLGRNQTAAIDEMKRYYGSLLNGMTVNMRIPQTQLDMLMNPARQANYGDDDVIRADSIDPSEWDN